MKFHIFIIKKNPEKNIEIIQKKESLNLNSIFFVKEFLEFSNQISQ